MENKYLVVRENGNVEVAIMFNEFNGAYHFVNLTKGHICPCEFESVYDAIEDMQKKKESGEIIDYIKMEC